MTDEIILDPVLADATVAPVEVTAEVVQVDTATVEQEQVAVVEQVVESASLGTPEEVSSVVEPVSVVVAQNEPVVQVADVPVVAEEPVGRDLPRPPQLGGNEAVAQVEYVSVEAPAVVPVVDTASLNPAQVTQPATALSLVRNNMHNLFIKAQQAIQNRKQKKFERIMGMFSKQANITNNDVEKLLHISDATASRYLSQLEKDSKIKQGDKKGSGVSYSRI